MRYRVRCRDGRSIWLLGGAVPSFRPPGRSFLGFLGSITQLAEAVIADGQAQGAIGSFVPLPTAEREPSRSSLEAAADHLITAHALLSQGGSEHLLSALRTVLHQVGLELAKGSAGTDHRTRVHHPAA